MDNSDITGAAVSVFGWCQVINTGVDVASAGPPEAIRFSQFFLTFIGVCEVLGGLGLVLPGLTRIRKGLTVLAAFGLAIIMIGAIVTGFMGEGIKTAIAPLIVGLLCVFVAYGRREWLTAKE